MCPPRKSRAEKLRQMEYEESCVTLRENMGDDDTTPRKIHFTRGKPVNIETNCYDLSLRDDMEIYQYDVSLEPEILSSKLITHFVYTALNPDGGPRAANERWQKIIFDGYHIIYSSDANLAGEYEVSPREGSEDKKVIVKIVMAKTITSENREQMLAIYNSAFRKAYRERGLTNFRRKWIDERTHHNSGRFRILDGYIPSICSLQGGLSYIIDTACRIDREGTLYNLLRDSRSDRKRREDMWQALQTVDVQTTHVPNKPKMIRVSSINWDRTPNDTYFEWQDKKTNEKRSISVADYFLERYGHQCKPDDVIIEERQQGDANAPPNMFPSSVLKISGLLEHERRDTRTMRDIATVTKIDPEKKKRRLDDFISSLKKDNATAQFFERWGCQIGESRKLTGRTIEPPKLQMTTKGPRSTVTDISLDRKLGWQGEMKNHGLYHVSKYNSPCLIVAHAGAKYTVDKIREGFGKVANGLHFDVPGCDCEYVESRHENAYMVKIAQYCKERTIPSFVLVVLPDDDKSRYSAIKTFLTVNIGIPSQMVLEKTAVNDRGANLSVITNLVVQIASKTGCIPFRVSPDYMSTVHTMVIGLALTSGKGGAPVCAGTASRDRGFTQYYSDSRSMTYGDCTIAKDFLEEFIKTALDKYHKDNNEYPERVVIYRDGVSYGQMPKLKGEARFIESILNDITRSTVCVTYIIAQKHCSIKVLNADSGSVRNADAGTVVTDGIGVHDVAEFYMISHFANQGSAAPTRYTIIHHSPVMWEDDQLILMTHYQCLQYPNWSGAIRIPACLMLASKLAETSLQYLGSEPANENLRDFLHYL